MNSYIYFYKKENNYINGWMTFGKNNIQIDTENNNFKIPYPFSILDIRLNQSSSGKCWLFYLNNLGRFIGCYFPSGYNVFGNSDIIKQISGKYFIENRNILKNSNGIIAAVIPKKPELGINKCEIILINKMSFNQNGQLILTYSKLKRILYEKDMSLSYKNTGLVYQHFEHGFQDLVSNLNIRYMNDISHHILSEGQIQMNFDGPDIIYQPFRKVDDVINIKSELKKNVQFLKFNKKKMGVLIKYGVIVG